jgi:two-component system, NarL family, sensor histidine kinase EvgS
VSGFDVGKGLREEHGPGMRIAAISGYAQSDHRRRALEGGFDEYFVKPVGIDALRACIERAPAKG